MTLPTPSQTVGPFYGYALPFPGGDSPAPAGDPAAITVHGLVLDGAGQPVPDALLEFWQPGPDGSRAGRPGSMRRNQVTGGFLGRDGVDFTGFARIATDRDGRYALHTLPPGGVPYLAVCVFARGLTHHLFTRAYLTDHPLYAADPLLATLAAERRTSLQADREDGRRYRFDIRLQGEKETTFLVFE
ncbi:protocatechuate 3,4-dioxygenase subunit alpha [Streptacidiphilus sp. N1-12]|uniref:Protocatechuate 3,4-dioxygenase subunit alpha n=2 Tax=Streptacidiphilus alkalitolerans TaxID=3342712 RepID=A0ABV6VD48_9ACTN